MRALLVPAVLLAAGSAATAAQAHAHLTGASPKAASTAPAPARLTLRFSEGLVARFSTFDLSGPSGPVRVKVAASGATLTGTPARPLAPGGYTVRWRVVSTDTHRSQGVYDFTVR